MPRESDFNQPLCAVMHSAQLCAGLPRRQAASRMNAGVAGIKGEDALHITFDFRRGETEGRQSCHAAAADAMTMALRPNRIRPFVTGRPSTGANEVPGIGTVRRTAGDEAAVRSLSKDSSPLAPLGVTKLWRAPLRTHAPRTREILHKHPPGYS